MKELILDNGKIIYDEIYDGGGSIFGINALKDERVINVIKKGNILEMCSGPGFMGFFLNLQGFANDLVLSDINESHSFYIRETILQKSGNNLFQIGYFKNHRICAPIDKMMIGWIDFCLSIHTGITSIRSCSCSFS